MNKVFGHRKSPAGNSFSDHVISSDAISRMLGEADGQLTPVRISKIGYGHNPSFFIEYDQPPYRAILKTYSHLWARERQKNESASLKYLSPVMKELVPEVYGESSDQENVPWLLLEWKNGRCLADAIADLSPEDRSDVIFQSGQLCRRIHNLKVQGVGPMTLESGLDRSWADFFLEQCHRLLDPLSKGRILGRRLMGKVRRCLLDDAPTILNKPIPSTFLQHDFHYWNMQIEKRTDRWEISGLFDFEFSLRGDARLDLAWTEHVHDRYLRVPIDWPVFFAGYGEDDQILPEEIKTIYRVYREVLAIRFFMDLKHMEQFSRHLRTVRSLFQKG